MSHPPFGRRHEPTVGKSHIWLGSLRCWDLGLMPFSWPVGNTKQYPLKLPSSDCAGGAVRTKDLTLAQITSPTSCHNHHQHQTQRSDRLKIKLRPKNHFRP